MTIQIEKYTKVNRQTFIDKSALNIMTGQWDKHSQNVQGQALIEQHASAKTVQAINTHWSTEGNSYCSMQKSKDWYSMNQGKYYAS